MINIQFKKTNEFAKEPVKAHNSDAAFDMYAITVKNTPNYIEYHTGIKMNIPEGYAGFLFPRSSITERPLMLKNSVGIIDSGYTGVIKFRFYKTNEQGEVYNPGDRIGQIVILPIPEVTFEQVEQLEKTERNEGGFGSTGETTFHATKTTESK